MSNLEEQWAQDILEFGDEAYTKWHGCGIHDYPNPIYSDFLNNAEVSEILCFSLEHLAYRKISAKESKNSCAGSQ
jgi:hypothetical protein